MMSKSLMFCMFLFFFALGYGIADTVDIAIIKEFKENQRKLISLLYSVEEYLTIDDDYYSDLGGKTKRAILENSWIEKRDRLIEEIGEEE